MASQKKNKTEALGNMLFEMKDKLGDDEYKKMYELIGEIHKEHSKPYYRVVWLKLQRCLGNSDGTRISRWQHLKTVSIVEMAEWPNQAVGPTFKEVPCQWLNKTKMGHSCVVTHEPLSPYGVEAEVLHFYDSDSCCDNKDFLIDPDREDIDEIPTITGGYFISIEKL